MQLDGHRIGSNLGKESTAAKQWKGKAKARQGKGWMGMLNWCFVTFGLHWSGCLSGWLAGFDRLAFFPRAICMSFHHRYGALCAIGYGLQSFPNWRSSINCHFCFGLFSYFSSPLLLGHKASSDDVLACPIHFPLSFFFFCCCCKTPPTTR